MVKTVFTCFFVLIVIFRVAEMAQQLRAVAVPPEDQGLIEAPTWQLTTTCKSSSNISDALFWSLKAPGPHIHIKK